MNIHAILTRHLTAISATAQTNQFQLSDPSTTAATTASTVVPADQTDPTDPSPHPDPASLPCFTESDTLIDCLLSTSMPYEGIYSCVLCSVQGLLDEEILEEKEDVCQAIRTSDYCGDSERCLLETCDAECHGEFVEFRQCVWEDLGCDPCADENVDGGYGGFEDVLFGGMDVIA